jgi:hypothetical protein
VWSPRPASTKGCGASSTAAPPASPFVPDSVSKTSCPASVSSVQLHRSQMRTTTSRARSPPLPPSRHISLESLFRLPAASLRSPRIFSSSSLMPVTSCSPGCRSGQSDVTGIDDGDAHTIPLPDESRIRHRTDADPWL